MSSSASRRLVAFSNNRFVAANSAGWGGRLKAEPKIQQALAEAVLDPVKAAEMLKAAKLGQTKLPPNVLQHLAAQAARSATPATLLSNR